METAVQALFTTGTILLSLGAIRAPAVWYRRSARKNFGAYLLLSRVIHMGGFVLSAFAFQALARMSDMPWAWAGCVLHTCIIIASFVVGLQGKGTTFEPRDLSVLMCSPGIHPTSAQLRIAHVLGGWIPLLVTLAGLATSLMK
jgi:hypothetical protein